MSILKQRKKQGIKNKGIHKIYKGARRRIKFKLQKKYRIRLIER